MVAPQQKKQVPYGIEDIWRVEAGKPYRGQLVENIDMSSSHDKFDDQVKIKRTINLESGMVINASSWHSREDVFVDGELLLHHEIPIGDHEGEKPEKEIREQERKERRELLRLQARDMMKNDLRYGSLQRKLLSRAA